MAGGVPFLDLTRELAEVGSEARRRIDAVLASGIFVLGSQTRELETALAARLGLGSALACSSGSDALYLAMLALGIGAGDAVVVPAFTFFATAGAVWRAGALPVFADLDPATYNTEAEQFEEAVERWFEGPAGTLRHRATGARLRALVPVHLFGRAVGMRAVLDLALRHGVAVVEDAAQAIDCSGDAGAAGSAGAVGCFSFYPTKNLGGPGDGGLVATGDPELAARLTRLRTHGAAAGSYEHVEVGINARMSELHAAVLNAKLERLADWTEQRVRHATLYREALAGAEAGGRLRLPAPAAEGAHVYHQFTVRVPRSRDRVRQRLEGAGVASRVFYPKPLHLQPCFAAVGYREGDLPEAEKASVEVVSLPMYPALTADDVELVCRELVAALEEAEP